AKLDTDGVGVAVIAWHLPRVVGGDALVGKLKSRIGGGVDTGDGGIDLRFGHGNTSLIEVEMIEALRVVDERRVALSPDTRNDFCCDGVDVVRHFAFGGEERGEALFEIWG